MITINQVSSNLRKFVKKLVGNRVFDLYLKYKGIKMVTSATLVPFALIMGRDAFKRFMKKDMVLEHQIGGGIGNIKKWVDTKLPIIDNELFGSYLKLTGLTALNLTPSTLVPLGVLMSIYHMYGNTQNLTNKQTGGNYPSVGNLKKNVRKILGNRVLDIYLKYMGIKMLTSATLIPFALLFGREAFKNYIFDDSKEQIGGTRIPDNLPFIDDELLGSYLKVMGITVLDLTMQTLVPLGILMTIYELYLNKSSNSGLE